MKIGLNGRNQGGVGEILLPSASFSLRGRPRTSAPCVDGRRKMESGSYYEGAQRKFGLNGRNQGMMGEILHPSAPASLRGRPCTYAPCVEGRWEM